MGIPAPTADSTALVTGASSGIGEALALQLAARGHHLTLVARRRERLDELAARIRELHGVEAEVAPCDLADRAARTQLVADVRAGGRRVSVLVNNAGFATGGDFATIDADREVEQVRVLIEAVVDLTSSFLPEMIDHRAGAILNVASTAGFQPLPWSAGYSAAKAHTLTFSEALHHEVAVRGVTVTALCPGPVRTEFWKVAGDQPIKKTMPKPMWVSTESVASAALNGLERGRRVVVPGGMVRMSGLGARWTPHGIQLPLLARAMKPTPTRRPTNPRPARSKR
ncbi:SDR family NAD(P)-dependent oxidoreductase [Nocardioides montaniterrae]